MTWWIATVSPSCERRAQDELHALGIETWLPLRAVEFKARHMKTAEWRVYPAWPGYILVKPDGQRTVFEDRSIDGYGLHVPVGTVAHRYAAQELSAAVRDLRGVLLNDGRPLTISDERMAVEARKMVCSTVKMVREAFRIGDKVVVSDGPFMSFRAFISSTVSGGRVKAEVDFMGRRTPVDFELAQLERVA